MPVLLCCGNTVLCGSVLVSNTVVLWSVLVSINVLYGQILMYCVGSCGGLA